MRSERQSRSPLPFPRRSEKTNPPLALATLQGRGGPGRLGWIEQLELAQQTAILHGLVVDPLAQPFSGFIGLAVGSDGVLYAVDGRFLYRFDPELRTATRIGPCGGSIAADKQGHLYMTEEATVVRIDIATGQVRAVVGAPGAVGVSLGALPGSLNDPRAVAVTDSGDLLIANAGEYVVLRARFQ